MNRIASFAVAALLPLALAVGPPKAAAAETPAYPHGDFMEDCGTCHTGDVWTPAVIAKSFRHTARFPLAGAHLSASCRSCHASLDFKKASTLCADCHRDPHIGELGADCGRCHTPRNFIDRSAQLDAHRLTRFPLTGAHVTRDCQECHAPAPQGQLQYVNTPVDCQACHLPQYQATTDPNHVTAGFPTTCEQCHTPTTWSRARFDHRAAGFPLTGAHTTVPCASCHTNGYAGTPTACVACHLADYQGTTDPNHVAQNYPTDCSICHNTTSFQNASFNHATTSFPLTGRHTTTPCVQCHASGYTGTPTACVACHNADYQTAADPNHVGAGFSTDCASCHNTTSFQGARYTQHDALYFPIYSGAHNGRWNSCGTCHSLPSDYGVFDCLGCHTNPGTDSHHNGVSGYQYNSQACYTCHPNGRAGN
jgi:hypothetical protein